MKTFIKVLSVLFLATFLSSCLKDDPAFDPSESSGSTIEISVPPRSPATSLYPIVVNSFEVSAEAEFTVTVNYAGATPAPADISVTIGVDPSALTKYDESQTASMSDDEKDDYDYYQLLPESLYTISSTTLTIPKGQRQATTTIKVKPDQFDLTAKYGLPIKITQASSGVISGNYSTVIYQLGAKNKYDGIYDVTGTYKDFTNAAFSGVYPKEIYLVTLNANSNYYSDPTELSVPGYLFYTGTGYSYYGNWAPVFTFDADGNVTSVTNYYGQTNASNRSGVIDPTGVNKFYTTADGVKTLEVSYYMIQSGAQRIHVTEKFVYKSAR